MQCLLEVVFATFWLLFMLWISMVCFDLSSFGLLARDRRIDVFLRLEDCCLGEKDTYWELGNVA